MEAKCLCCLRLMSSSTNARNSPCCFSVPGTHRCINTHENVLPRHANAYRDTETTLTLRILSSWQFSLCIHQDSQLAYLVVVESYPHLGRLHLSEINHRGPLLTKRRADFPVTLREAREYGSVCLTKGTVGAGGLMRKIPFSSLGLSILVFATFSGASSAC